MRSVLLSIAVAAVLASCGSDNALQDTNEQATVEPSEASSVATAPDNAPEEAGGDEGEDGSEGQMFPDVIGAEGFACAHTGEHGHESALRALRSAGPERVGTTFGIEGVVGLDS